MTATGVLRNPFPPHH